MELMVCIIGVDFDLRELSKSFMSQELSLFKKEDEYKFHHADKIRNKVRDFSLINRASRLVLGSLETISMDSVVKTWVMVGKKKLILS